MQQHIPAKNLRCLYCGKRIARHIGCDLSILDAFDAVLDRDHRRSRTRFCGLSYSLRDDLIGHERPRAVMHCHERTGLRRGRDTCEDRFGTGIAAARQRAQLCDAVFCGKRPIDLHVLLAADQYDVANGAAHLKRRQRMREHGLSAEREQQLVFASHAPRRAGRNNDRTDRLIFS